jgi:DNA sulfur modification protein DndB
MATEFEYVFPAIKGIQAGREYFVSMCPLRLLSRIFSFNEEADIPAELRAQRQLNRARIPEIAKYIIDNHKDYVFSAITASIDADVRFDQFVDNGEGNRVGLLHIPMSARFVINDGQHRRAAIEFALREKPSLGDETIAVVFFLDVGLQRCQQMFADLNRHAIRPSSSIGVLYDHRDSVAGLTKSLVLKSATFRDVVELEKTTLSPRSRRLFTLSAIYHANHDLMDGINFQNEGEAADFILVYWEEVAKHINEWALVRKGQITAGEVRQDFIHSHGVVLQALARAGNTLIKSNPNDWKKKLTVLREINWSRSNARLWEGRALVGGRVSKAQQNVVLTANAIKNKLLLKLGPEEQRLEDAFRRGE